MSRTSATYARLSFHIGPGATANLPVAVDWAAFPGLLDNKFVSLDKLNADWTAEFCANINPMPMVPAPNVYTQPRDSLPDEPILTGSPFEPFAPGWDWNALDQELMEEYERHARIDRDEP